MARRTAEKAVYNKIYYHKESVATNTWTSEIFKDLTRVHWVHVVYASSAIVGQRHIHLGLGDSTQQWADWHTGVRQLANNVYHYEWMSGIPMDSTTVEDNILAPIPHNLIILPNHTLSIYDHEDVDANDTMLIMIQYEEM